MNAATIVPDISALNPFRMSAMNGAAYDASLRLSDSLERRLMNQVYSRPVGINLVDDLKKVGSAIKRGVIAFFAFLDEVNRAMDEAHARNGNISTRGYCW
ncbi:hypothetical protein [Corticimicrobacter populi]|uniref:Uncharacterized protein n=1 Tax=Corticimicrobacter populi TaxID=2175229 RepID=A0A2V1K3H6_9BURK|nr:hypothetical protein [Corticimicrobacter populi]PWF23903.1 hypothetical protein DD235_06105 [Corticimicrobacter populi]QDQ88251.1 hypothetical protein FMZ60_12070 [Alcaligenaceae bacterium SJ-26]